MSRPAQGLLRGFGSAEAVRSGLSTRRTFKPGKADGSSVLNKHYALYEHHVLPLLLNGRLADAEPILNLLSQSNTSLSEVYRDLADLAEARGDARRAQHHRDRWLEHPANHPSQLEAQATLADELGRSAQAFGLWGLLLERQPGHRVAVVAAARHLMHLELFEDAYQVIQRANLDPASFAHSEAICLQAICALEMNQASQALRLALISLGQAESCLGHACVAAALHQQRDEQQSLIHLQQALGFLNEAVDPPWPIARLLGSVFLDQRRLLSAERFLSAAYKQQPSSQLLHEKLGELLLIKGQLSRGFECIAKSRRPPTLPNTGLPPFDMKAPIGPLALVADSTLGDTLWLSRYAPWIEEQLQLGVNLYVQPPVLELLRTGLPCSIGVFPADQLQRQACGSILPLLSAPGLFGACDKHPILSKPRLKADAGRIAELRKRLALEPGERLIAINWHGSAMQALRERVPSDVPLDTFAALARLPRTRLVSLQKGFGAEQLKRCTFRERFVACQDEIDREHRLEEMAALMTICDWIVCDDSGPAHLAGSLARPTIVLLANRCDWRWGADRDASAWYPSLHLIRDCGSGREPWQKAMGQAAALITGDRTMKTCNDLAAAPMSRG